MRNTFLTGDSLTMLQTLPDESVQCVVTSPPYWGLRDYGTPAQAWGGDPGCRHDWEEHLQPAAEGTLTLNGNSALRAGHQGSNSATMKPKLSAFCCRCNAWRGSLGLEPSPELFISHLVEIFAEVRRVLRRDGTLWLNLGDSYSGSWGNYHPHSDGGKRGNKLRDSSSWNRPGYDGTKAMLPPTANCPGLKPKDLVMMPARVAIALQADGYYPQTQGPCDDAGAGCDCAAGGRVLFAERYHLGEAEPHA